MNIVAEDKVKGMLITKTAIRTLQSMETVEKVINFQFKNANINTKIVNEIEISGLGKMMISSSKLRKNIKKMQNSISKFERLINDLNTPQDKIEVFKRRLNECSEALAFLEEKNQRYEN